MKKITKALILFCLAFVVNVQAQQIIFEDFENGDPFEMNDNVTTGYNKSTFSSSTCPDPHYAIRPNFNSLCNAFPNVPATNPNPGKCMSTNEDNTDPDFRLLYREGGLSLDPGFHVVRFRTVQRHGAFNPPHFEENTTISVALTNTVGNFVSQTVSLPLNSNSWIGQTVILNPTTATSIFGLTVTNPQLNGDFAIDDIDLCAINVELTSIGPDRWCMEEDVNICGEVEGCGFLDYVELRIGRNNQVLLTLDVNINPDGTFCYTSPNAEELFSLGLEAGTFYDVVPVLVLNDANQTEVIGDSHENGLNNDFRLRGQTEASAIMNKDINDEVNDFNSFCEGDPIFFHGRAELSDRFFVGIERRLPGNPNASWNWVGGKSENYNFDGAHYDLTNEWNFELGYEYKVTFGVQDVPNCIGWTPVNKIFEIIDCCLIEPITHSAFPSCTFEGHVFTMDVLFNESLTEEDIALIYSTSPNFELLSTSMNISQPSGRTTITLTFESGGCSCDGDMLSFDIRLVGCTNNIWIMSENIPCCESDCSEIDLEYLEITGKCEIINGAITYPFEGALDLVPGTEVVSITAQGTNGLCPTRIAIFDFEVFNNTVIFSGTLQSLNPNCEWGDIELVIETGVACCTFVLPFSYPPCKLGGCLEDQPELQSLCNSQLTIAVPNSSGGVTLTNNLTGQVTSPFIGTVQCVSHISSNGNVVTYPCDGFIYNFNANCAQLEDPEASKYDITITIGRCQYRFVGDFCKPFACGVSEYSGGGSESRSADVEEVETNFEANLFPNPIVAGATLTISSTTLIKEVSLLDVQGRLITSQHLDQTSTSLSLTTPNEIQPGVYVVKLLTVHNEIKVMRLLVLND